MEDVPEHIALVPDGNRRWAVKNNKSIEEAYDKGIRNLGNLAQWAHKAGVKTLTLWGFSTENFKRGDEEKSVLWKQFSYFLQEGLKRYRTEKRKEFTQVRVNFLGRIHLFPKPVYTLMKEVMKITKNNKPYTVNFLMAYGGRAEIVDAVSEVIKKGIKKVDEEIISNHLYTAGQKDPDLIIRTANERRLSGLLPWQSVYSEFYFSDKFWPDFSESDFKDALDTYKMRKRKFGK